MPEYFGRLTSNGVLQNFQRSLLARWLVSGHNGHDQLILARMTPESAAPANWLITSLSFLSFRSQAITCDLRLQSDCNSLAVGQWNSDSGTYKALNLRTFLLPVKATEPNVEQIMKLPLLEFVTTNVVTHKVRTAQALALIQVSTTIGSMCSTFSLHVAVRCFTLL